MRTKITIEATANPELNMSHEDLIDAIQDWLRDQQTKDRGFVIDGETLEFEGVEDKEG